MLGKIISVAKSYEIHVPNNFRERRGDINKDVYFTGYVITTTKHTFKILVTDGPIFGSCCEIFRKEIKKDGDIITEDNINYFVGEELLDIKAHELGTGCLDCKEEEYCKKEINTYQFIDLKTSSGVLQFALYNCHNGYYGYYVVVLKDDKILTENEI